MSRDLFTETFTPRPAPRRSKWMIVASVLAHGGIGAALIFIPIMSAAEAFVFRANDAFTYSVPIVPAPPPSAPPTASRQSVAPATNREVAPAAPPEQPVTTEVARHTGPPGPPGPVGLDRISMGPTIPGVPPGSSMPLLALPPSTPERPVRPGGDIKAPDRITYVEPVYPLVARAAKVEGRVILEATIDGSGSVRDVRVLRSDPLFDRAAVEAVSRWRYTPTRLNGVAVPILLTVTVTFSLR